jgi:predicted ArsR family transcriptional regulator
METDKKPLNVNESNALKIVVDCIEQAYTTDEITHCVAYQLGISQNAAKGYLGQLTEKNYIKKSSYIDGIGRNKKTLHQFEVL